MFAPNNKHRPRVAPARRGEDGLRSTIVDAEERTLAERHVAMTSCGLWREPPVHDGGWPRNRRGGGKRAGAAVVGKNSGA